MCEVCKRYSEDQPRDPDGKFASGGNSLSSEEQAVATERLAAIPSRKAGSGYIDISKVFGGDSDLLEKYDATRPALGSAHTTFSKVEKVDASTLVPTQDWLARAGVESYIKNPPDELPHVVASGGKNYVTEGHTRLASQLLAGRKSVKVKVYIANDRSLRYSEDQPRDPDGKFASGGGETVLDQPAPVDDREYVGESKAPDGSVGFFSAKEGGTLFHGTGKTLPGGKFKAGETYTAVEYNETHAFAKGEVPGAGGGPRPWVVITEAQPGKTLDVNAAFADMIENGDPAEDEPKIYADARAAGARYITFDHPSTVTDGTFKVIVSLYPNEDLKSKGGYALSKRAMELMSAAPTGVIASGTDRSVVHKYGTTQVDIPDGEAAFALEHVRALIEDEHLAGQGRNVEGNHITVRYGYMGDVHVGVESFLAGQLPFEVTLGPTFQLSPTEHSDGAAVIIAPVESKDLHRIHESLDVHGLFKLSDFDYTPHATVAYVQPEHAYRYVGLEATSGKKVRVDAITINKRDGTSSFVKLTGMQPQAENPALHLGIGYGPLAGQQFPEACSVDLGPQGEPLLRYSEDQPRDPDGKFASGGGMTQEKAASLWERYSIASSIKDVSKTGVPAKEGDSDGVGGKMTAKDAEEINQAAATLQQAAEGKSQYKSLWRGEVYESEKDAPDFMDSVGDTRTLDALTATSNLKEVAEKYTDTQFIGTEPGSGFTVMYHFTGNLKGFDSKAYPETIMPKGATFVVKDARYNDAGNGYVIEFSPAPKSQTTRSLTIMGAFRYSEDQPRDPDGKFGSGEGSSKDKDWNPADDALADHSEWLNGGGEVDSKFKVTDQNGNTFGVAATYFHGSPKDDISVLKADPVVFLAPKRADAEFHTMGAGKVYEVDTHDQLLGSRSDLKIFTMPGNDIDDLGSRSRFVAGLRNKGYVGAISTDGSTMAWFSNIHVGGARMCLMGPQGEPLEVRYSDDQPRDEHGKFTSGGGSGDQKPDANGQWDPATTTTGAFEGYYNKIYPEVQPGEKVDGRTVLEDVDNMSSIGASISNYLILDGVREVDFTQFDMRPDITERTKALAEEIKSSGELMPLIVGVDNKGPYIMEGSHRYDALKILGATKIPAIVVLDLDELRQPKGERSLRFDPDQPRDEQGKFTMGNVATFKNEEEGTEAHVTSFNGKFHVNLFDTDSGQQLPSSIYSGEGAKDKAIAQAKKLAGLRYSPDQPRDPDGKFASGVTWVPDKDINSDSEFKYDENVKEVPIDKVIGGEQMALSQTHYPSKVNKFAKKMEKGGAKFKAIAVNRPDKNGNYKIRDGHHRWLAALQAGLKTIGVHEFIKYERNPDLHFAEDQDHGQNRDFNPDQPRDSDGKFAGGFTTEGTKVDGDMKTTVYKGANQTIEVHHNTKENKITIKHLDSNGDLLVQQTHDSVGAARKELQSQGIDHKFYALPSGRCCTYRYSPDQPRDPDGKFASGGGSPAEEPGAGVLKGAEFLKPDMTTHEARSAMARNAARELKFPVEKVVTDPGPGKDFTVGGRAFTEGGHAEIYTTGNIVIFTQNNSDTGIRGVVAHEVEHVRFQGVLEDYNSEMGHLHDWAQHDHEQYDKVTDPVGFLDPEKGSGAVLPTATALQPYMELNIDQLAKDDGVTEYSKAYWDAVKSPESVAKYGGYKESRERAIHETLAEMARMKFTKDNYATGLKPSKLWTGLFKEVNTLAKEKGYGYNKGSR